MPTEVLSSTARSRESRNKLRPEDKAVHDWYRFVLSFPPHLVQDYVDRFGLTASDTVLDPFCGTGTTLVECKKVGIGSVGIESTPIRTGQLLADLARSLNYKVTGIDLFRTRPSTVTGDQLREEVVLLEWQGN